MENIKRLIRDIPDFPKSGILFKDIMPALENPDSYKQIIDWFVKSVVKIKIDKVVGAEARGFIFAAPVAYNLGAGLTVARKPGKLPYETVSQEYSLEYGTDRFEMHKDSIKPGENVLIIDDLLATGGTSEAITKMVETLGGKVVAVRFLIELAFLNGDTKFKNYNLESMLKI